jgi:hypothetical protein
VWAAVGDEYEQGVEVWHAGESTPRTATFPDPVPVPVPVPETACHRLRADSIRPMSIGPTFLAKAM